MRAKTRAQLAVELREALELLGGFFHRNHDDGSRVVQAIQMAGNPESRIQGAINLAAAYERIERALRRLETP